MKYITMDQYLQLRGLQVLAHEHDKKLTDCVAAMARILGETHDPEDGWGGHAGDLAIGGVTVAEVMEKLSIIIEAPSEQP